MSIIIKGMMKPENCVECPISTIYCDLWRERNEEDMYKGCHPDCPIGEIPPHGRLIDENDVMKSAEELRQSPWYKENDFLHIIRKDGFETAIDLTVKDAPTIIDAEMEEDATEKR